MFYTGTRFLFNYQNCRLCAAHLRGRAFGGTSILSVYGGRLRNFQKNMAELLSHIKGSLADILLSATLAKSS